MTHVIVIAGWERSGSTIVANTLGSVPGVVSVGEINNIWERGFEQNRICSCEERFDACPFWRPIATAAFGAEIPNVAARAAAAIEPLGNLGLWRSLLPFAGGNRALRDEAYRDLLAPLFGSIQAATGADAIVDSSKLPWHAAAVAGLEGIDVTVLHVVRDPRGVAHSHLKRARYDTDASRDILMDRHGLVPSSLAWVYRNRLTAAMWGAQPNYVLVRLEDFVASPREAIARILRTAGVPPAQPSFTEQDEVVIEPMHNVSGNPVRFAHGPVTLAVDESWRQELSPNAQRFVAAVTWPHRRRFGYR